LSDRKRKRRPGGGRKPIDPQGAVIAPVRFTKDEWEAINHFGERSNLKRSQVIRAAVRYWLQNLQYPHLHVAALTHLIAILIKRIEGRSGRKWVQDAETAAAVREEIGVLIDSLAPVAKEGLVVSPKLRQIARDLLVVVGHLYQEPKLGPVLAGEDDWSALAVIAKDLGPAFLRNLTTDVTISEVKA